MCADGVFHSERGSTESSMSTQHFFTFLAIFFKSASGKDSNIFVFTKHIEKYVKTCFRKKVLFVSKNWWENPVYTHVRRQEFTANWAKLDRVSGVKLGDRQLAESHSADRCDTQG